MLSLPARSEMRPIRLWKTITADEAASVIGDLTTVAVEEIGDGLAQAIARSFRERGRPHGLTVLYAATRSLDRDHGLNRLAQEGLVRRVIGGQWYPVPALHRLAMADRIEAYSLPSGIIQHMLRVTASGEAAYVTRTALGSFTDPRNGGGRLNPRTREPMVFVTQPPLPEALVFPALQIDVGIVEIGFRAETATLVMSKEGATLAEATHRRGGIVIAQSNRPGTIERLRRGQIEVAESLVDFVVIGEDDADREFLFPRREVGSSA